MYRTTTAQVTGFDNSRLVPSFTLDLQEKVQAARNALYKSKEKRAPSRCSAVSAQIHGASETVPPLMLKDSPEEDRRLAVAKAKFRAEWKFNQALAQKDVIVPKDGSTLKLLYSPEYAWIFCHNISKHETNSGGKSHMSELNSSETSYNYRSERAPSEYDSRKDSASERRKSLLKKVFGDEQERLVIQLREQQNLNVSEPASTRPRRSIKEKAAELCEKIANSRRQLKQGRNCGQYPARSQGNYFALTKSSINTSITKERDHESASIKLFAVIEKRLSLYWYQFNELACNGKYGSQQNERNQRLSTAIEHIFSKWRIQCISYGLISLLSQQKIGRTRELPKKLQPILNKKRNKLLHYATSTWLKVNRSISQRFMQGLYLTFSVLNAKKKSILRGAITTLILDCRRKAALILALSKSVRTLNRSLNQKKRRALNTWRFMQEYKVVNMFKALADIIKQKQ